MSSTLQVVAGHFTSYAKDIQKIEEESKKEEQASKKDERFVALLNKVKSDLRYNINHSEQRTLQDLDLLDHIIIYLQWLESERGAAPSQEGVMGMLSPQSRLNRKIHELFTDCYRSCSVINDHLALLEEQQEYLEYWQAGGRSLSEDLAQRHEVGEKDSLTVLSTLVDINKPVLEMRIETA